MGRKINNLDKSSGVFKCRHPAHKSFGYAISPYHALSLKKCYPRGCVEFLWRCRMFEKGQPCPRDFKHVGRGCFSCKHYHEEKIAYAPEISLDDSQARYFIDDYREYQGWLDDMDGKTIEFSGVIESVKPHLAIEIEARRSNVNLDGYYASFLSGYINNDLFDDKIYLRLSGTQLDRLNPAPDDSLDCETIFTHSRGRIILQRARKINLSHNGGQRKINRSRALVGRATGAIIEGSLLPCKGCQYCSMADITDMTRLRIVFYRRFFCLRGVSDPENCPVRLEEILRKEESSPDSAE